MRRDFADLGTAVNWPKGSVLYAPVPESDGRRGDAAAGDGRGGGRGVPDAVVRAVRLTGCIARVD